MRFILCVLASLWLPAAITGCSTSNPDPADAGADGGNDASTDTDTDTDTDSDTDTDTELVCTGETYDGDFEIATAEDLADIAGFEEITGTLKISCVDCTDLSLLGCLTTVGASLYINDNDVLTNLDGLDAITSPIGNYLTVRNNGFLTDMSGLNGITVIVGQLWITVNGSMNNCQATDFRDALTSYGGVCIEGNLPDTCPDDLTDCN